jgi:hypothetical protein
VLFALTVFVSVAAVTGIVSAMARRAFDRANDERTTALVGQFRREFTRRGEEVSRKIQAITATSEAGRVAVAAARPAPDFASACATYRFSSHSDSWLTRTLGRSASPV